MSHCSKQRHAACRARRRRLIPAPVRSVSLSGRKGAGAPESFRVLAGLVAILLVSTGCQRFAKPDEPVEGGGGNAEVAAADTTGASPDTGHEGVVEASSSGAGVEGAEASGAETQAGDEGSTGGETGVSEEAASGAEEVQGTQAVGTKDPFERAVESIRAGPGRYPEALRFLDEALAENPRLAEAYYDKGVIFQELGDIEEAVKAYQKALELKPTLAVAAGNLATIYREQGMVARSLEVLDTALAASPDNPLLHNQKALSLEKAGKVEDATEEIRKILKINAIDVDAFVNLGCLYLRQGDYEMARLVFEKALLSVPGADENAYVHHNLGVAFLGLEDRRAASQFDLALKAKPDLVPALINRAYLYLKIQRFQEAADLLKRAVEVEPDNVVARMDLGVALRGLGEYDLAAIQYQEALKQAPDDPTVLLNYAILLDDYKHEYLAAVDVYERLRSVVEGEEEIKKVEKYIRIAKLNHQREERRRKRRMQRREESGEAAGGETAQPAEGGDGAGGSQPGTNAPAAGASEQNGGMQEGQ